MPWYWILSGFALLTFVAYLAGFIRLHPDLDGMHKKIDTFPLDSDPTFETTRHSTNGARWCPLCDSPEAGKQYAPLDKHVSCDEFVALAAAWADSDRGTVGGGINRFGDCHVTIAKMGADDHWTAFAVLGKDEDGDQTVMISVSNGGP
jgi:hypothetical protein